MQTVANNMRIYLRSRPALLAPLRAKEAYLFQQNLPFKGPVLDIGCGDGFFASVITGAGDSKQKSINKIDAGLDIVGSRIEQAQKSGVYKKTVTYNGRRMPFADDTFATVISNSTLEHIADLPIILKETYRVMKRGGEFMTTVIAAPWAEHYFGNKILGAWYKRWMTKKQEHVNLFTHRQWDDVFIKAGFKIICKIGHARALVSTWTDILHFLGIPNLISYSLTGKWVFFPKLAEKTFPISYFADMVMSDCNETDAVAIYYELRK
ncbi:hypothetical protein A2154_01745 [Candidatus Gottesmanbacteria bacterium RBG_16_43_7]|uniref:Methyltransferase type 11 domain-containing protein n=1 Tax=Candidatus Gottesmanbacteria bacterium RBG_16_43_7 TaxID=1798373 RepID=A0A1F5Z8Q1_9BACT|nr:MAG: hypothetical protein A2154_01745 [Candidatus Gottesmanbacteria bacterium RBG_16_43_7]